MWNINWAQLFPTKWSIFIFTLYILLFVNQGILVTASQESNNNYNYDVVTVVLMTEVMKLLVSAVLYCKDNSPLKLAKEALESTKVLALYFVPAFLYCLYNNLSFINLSTFDPTTYFLLMQLRVVITAVLFQLIFNKRLSKKQWLSLLLLTIGCMIKQVNFSSENDTKDDADEATQKMSGFHLNISTVFLLIQACCSCLAGVYNEYLLKETGANVNIFIQNIFMYLDSIICNVLLLLISNVPSGGTFYFGSLEKLLNYKVLLVMFNNTACGIVTSFFLKSLNSIVKNFASGLELVLTAICSYILFSIPIHLNTVISMSVVIYATFLYSQNPVSNPSSKNVKTSKAEDEDQLLMEEV